MFHPARWHRLVPLAIAAAVVVGAGSHVQAVAPPDRKVEAYEKAELIQLLRVNIATKADRVRLTTLDLDLAESAGKNFVDVVAYGNQDRRLLKLAGFTWSTLEDDLVGADKEREVADAAYDKAVKSRAILATLPSGRSAYRQLADYTNDLASLASQYPTKVKAITLKNTSLEGRTVRGIEISRDVNVSSGKPVFVMMGLHHAREWPSGELTIEFAYDLLKNDGVVPRITNILDKARVVIVPVVNPDGFNLSRTLGYEMKRKNCRITNGQLPIARTVCAIRQPVARYRPEPELRRLLGRTRRVDQPHLGDVPRRERVQRARDAQHPGARLVAPGDHADHQPHLLQPGTA